MPVYLSAQLDIHDREVYAAYEAGFMAIFQKYNGQILAVDETTEVLEGDWHYTRSVLIQFPNRADALAWFESPEYQSLAKHRRAAATGSIVMLKGRG